jgi:pyrrolysine biosynthesis protein PylC
MVLSAVKTWADFSDIPLAFDLDAYLISCSKIKSDVLFKKMSLPAPKSWPGCSFPVVFKPDQASGSQGVEIIDHQKALFEKLSHYSTIDDIIIQEFLEGPSFSLEVIGKPGNYILPQITDLGMDEEYDCKNVTAPTTLSRDHRHQFKKIAVAIAEKIELNGIMDVEVILCQNELKLLEIDARLPSQTPIAVYWSTGINMVESLVNLFINKKISSLKKGKFSIAVEHVKVSEGKIEFLGEHIMAQEGPLILESNFFGADEAITNYEPDKYQWVATMIFSGASRQDIDVKRKMCYKNVADSFKKVIREPVK